MTLRHVGHHATLGRVERTRTVVARHEVSVGGAVVIVDEVLRHGRVTKRRRLSLPSRTFDAWARTAIPVDPPPTAGDDAGQ